MNKMMTAAIALLTIIACGASQSGGAQNAQPVDTPVEETALDYTGSYELVGTEIDGSTYPAFVDISDSGDYYLLAWGIQGDAFWDNGIEISGYLGTAERAAGGPVGILQKQGNKLSGLFIGPNDTQAAVESSPGTQTFTVSSRDLTGTYSVQGGYDSGELFNHTMVLSRQGDTWFAVLKAPGMIDMEGRGLAVDNVLAVGFNSGEGQILKVYEISGKTLEGRWTFTAYDPETYQDYNVSGWEKAVRQ